jgi:hypothetical protein
MQRFKIEWSCENWVKPKLDASVVTDKATRDRREEPAQVNCGGWLHVMAPNKNEAIARFLSINSTRWARLNVTEA